MKSFGRLLKRLRGQTSLETMAERAGLEADYLAQVEAGQILVEEKLARQILRRGFDLHRPDADRLLLGIQLYDLGLKEVAFQWGRPIRKEDQLIGVGPWSIAASMLSGRCWFFGSVTNRRAGDCRRLARSARTLGVIR